jgi:DNA invertase Pin-like site-specific DNA recombinase
MIVMKKEKAKCVCPNPKTVLHGGLAELGLGHNRNLVAYLRETGGDPSVDQQAALIGQYCADHGHEITLTVLDGGNQADSMETAMESLANADGLIVTDLNRFVVHNNDRGRDLRPLLHEFMCAGVHKRLISIREGIDTATAAGQRAVMEVINQLKDADTGI